MFSTIVLPFLLAVSSVTAAGHDSQPSRRRHHARLASPSVDSPSTSSSPSVELESPSTFASVNVVSSPLVARAAGLPSGWKSSGCVLDAWSRALDGWGQTKDGWTASSCSQACDDKGFSIAGLEWGNECYCGNKLKANGLIGGLLGDLACGIKCPDGSSCGGWFGLSTYTKSATPAPVSPATSSSAVAAAPTTTSSSVAPAATTVVSTPATAWTNQGCVSDQQSARSLDGYRSVKLTGWKVDECVSTCQSKGFAMAGIEVGTECYCGNSFAPAANTRQTAAAECTWYCFGTPDVCGGPWRVSIFSDKPISSFLSGSPAVITTSTTLPASATTSTAVVAAPAPTVVAPPSSGGAKAAYVHFMVGNSYPYTYDMWMNDVKMASAAGFDGFALNIGTDSWQWNQVASAYEAAKNSGTGFKMFLSFDMTVMPCGSWDDAAALRRYITTYAGHPAQAYYQGKILASTFAGTECSFGQGGWNQGWQVAFKDVLSNGGTPVFFIPSIFVDPAQFGGASSLDGELNWNSGWPTGGAELDFSSDQNYMNNLGSKKYMAAVSPTFFTHYGVNSWNKNWYYDTDDFLFARRWADLVSHRDQFDLVEALTWNDFGESSYLGPIQGAQPNSHSWVDGFDHLPFLEINKYYSTAFKTGSYPVIADDRIFLTARPHHTQAIASSDSVGRPTRGQNGPPDSYQNVQNSFFAFVLAKADGSVEMRSGSISQTFAVTQGANFLSLALSTGSGMSATLVRSGKTVVSLAPKDYVFAGETLTYNWNVHAYSS